MTDSYVSSRDGNASTGLPDDSSPSAAPGHINGPRMPVSHQSPQYESQEQIGIISDSSLLSLVGNPSGPSETITYDTRRRFVELSSRPPPDDVVTSRPQLVALPQATPPIPPPMPVNDEKSRIRARKSIQSVVQEHERRIDQTSSADTSYANNMTSSLDLPSGDPGKAFFS